MMAFWIVREPYTHTDGRDYRPGDTVESSETPPCVSDCIEDDDGNAAADHSAQNNEVPKRRSRPPKSELTNA